MPTFTITYKGSSKTREQVTADYYDDEPPWITFYVGDTEGHWVKALRIREEQVNRIEKTGD